MKNAGTAAKSEGKQPVPKTVDEYLATVPQPARAALEMLRQTIRDAAPAATECISYQMPTFKHRGHLVSYAAWKNHCSLYGVGSDLMESHRHELSGYSTSKGTIQFSAANPLPAGLVTKFIRARIAENEARKG